MSLATRCTHCGTIFKVVQDQLKVSEGWVRCGRCHEVFNALPSLFDLDSEPPPPRQTAPLAMPAPEAPAPDDTPEQASTAPDEALPTAPDHAGETADATDSDANWSNTRPTELAPPTPISAHTPLTAADLAMDSAPLPSATDFDLDTSVGVSPPEPWEGEPPQDVPDTDESDALDSRYLLPTRDGTRQVRRRPPGPEFADAQFPSDAMLDAEDDWALDSVPAEALPSALPSPSPDTAEQPLSAAPLATSQAAPPRPSAHLPSAAPMPSASLLRSPESEDDTDILTTQPSRFGENFVPEQVQPPPSKRQGRSGTRGRDPATQPPEFVKRAQRQAFWRHPATRGALLTVLLGLVMGLGLQLMHQFRDLIAAYNPETRPLLTAWCEQVGCKIAPPLRLEVLQLDSATLLRTSSEGPDRYRLTVSVHNRADIDVAWPRIDLSLTDERGAVIARRAISASDARLVRTETTGPGQTLAPLPEAVPQQQSTTLQWSLRLDNLSPAGYTAELFYP